MFPTKNCSLAAAFAAALAILAFAERAPARPPRHQSSLLPLQQQNAFQQQQNAVQTALQQTTALVQTAHRQNAIASAANLQQQQNALQNALQQTYALLQISYRRNSALSQTALRQLNTLQTTLQQTITIQNALATLNGQPMTQQLGTLLQEQNNLTGLLTAQPPSQQRTAGR